MGGGLRIAMARFSSLKKSSTILPIIVLLDFCLSPSCTSVARSSRAMACVKLPPSFVATSFFRLSMLDKSLAARFCDGSSFAIRPAMDAASARQKSLTSRLNLKAPRPKNPEMPAEDRCSAVSTSTLSTASCAAVACDNTPPAFAPQKKQMSGRGW